MAQAFTPGLKVTKETIVKKRRILPLQGEVLVKKGDKVSYDQVIARTELPGNVQPLNVANKLGIAPEEVKDVMLKGEGEKIEQGENIALYKSFFGLFKNYVKAPIDGTIDNISDVTGQVLLREPPIPIEVDAYVNGKVIDVVEKEGAVVESVATFIQGIFGLSGEKNGEIVIAVNSRDEELTADMIKEEYKNKIVVGGSYIRAKAIKKAQKVGVSGIVVGGIDDHDIKELLGYDIGVAITGHEEIGFTLVVTEGFGEMHMAERTFDLLKENEGEWASINGATQIRAGVLRPEVIIPKEKDSADMAKESTESHGLEVGDQVRIIREPNFGEIAEIVEMIPELQELESESKARTFKVKLVETGEESIVPRANVEKIEE
ncbi:MAG: hypothetical protein FXF47_04695 [Candidatus Mcinerneyibacterium aminivorans]|uniref:KOW domain-containing protein n=1 Tax=Candidatus Mcinerneyibacterium aminivorans TaxID=2703815 RepID=A0A5D0MIQ6_9BACT|nr:MAG: hypothetical protein FXF47_04695 [Candidatus Mcinerneyibacterium aminivorans]